MEVRNVTTIFLILHQNIQTCINIESLLRISYYENFHLFPGLGQEEDLFEVSFDVTPSGLPFFVGYKGQFAIPHFPSGVLTLRIILIYPASPH